MGAGYVRPEFSKADLELVQAARCIVINPDRADVMEALAIAEKRCRKNRLPVEDALDAFNDLRNGCSDSIFLGFHECDGYFTYPIQVTVLQFVRLTDSLTGLVCDRQTVEPGCCSNPPIDVPEDGIFSGDTPVQNLNAVLAYFWPFLSDEMLDKLHNLCSLYVMGTLVPARRAGWTPQESEPAHYLAMKALYRGLEPEFTAEFAGHCRTIAHELTRSKLTSISWRDLKKQYPGVSARHQSELLSLVNDHALTVDALLSIDKTNEFDIRLTTWFGEMRIFDEPQLVLQLRNQLIHSEFCDRGASYQRFSELLREQAKGLHHPATENTVGWLRVHVDDKNRLCFVDEVQSDAMEIALEYSRKRSEYSRAAHEYMQRCSRWQMHAFSTIYHWALSIGYRAAIHSKDSARTVQFMTPSERKWNTYYRPIIKEYHLKVERFTGYPERIYVSSE